MAEDHPLAPLHNIANNTPPHSTQSEEETRAEDLSSASPSSPDPSARRVYKGSCHCGNIKYTCAISLPPSLDPAALAPSGTRIRKCNCSTCHKLSFFHVRPQHPPRDFTLLAPAGGPDACSVYRCCAGNVSWCFCGVCSAMVFGYWADAESAGEQVDVDVDGERRRVWRPREELKEGQAWTEGKNAYLSVNAVTLEPDQEGLDLREWHEKGYICYLDCKERVDDNHFGRPSNGGMY